MNKLFIVLIITALIACDNSNVPVSNESFYPEIQSVKLDSGILGERFKTVNEITIQHCIDKCIEMDIVENFSRAAGLTKGDYTGLANSDEF